ncbi:unnamed protein product [Symbiodinium sp. CCMP2592]|nr:unnamed protein product [Symbiodinium sp. CCMP2592]
MAFLHCRRLPADWGHHGDSACAITVIVPKLRLNWHDGSSEWLAGATSTAQLLLADCLTRPDTNLRVNLEFGMNSCAEIPGGIRCIDDRDGLDRMDDYLSTAWFVLVVGILEFTDLPKNSLHTSLQLHDRLAHKGCSMAEFAASINDGTWSHRTWRLCDLKALTLNDCTTA